MCIPAVAFVDLKTVLTFCGDSGCRVIDGRGRGVLRVRFGVRGSGAGESSVRSIIVSPICSSCSSIVEMRRFEDVRRGGD
jgi:hypothetical protein